MGNSTKNIHLVFFSEEGIQLPVFGNMQSSEPTHSQMHQNRNCKAAGCSCHHGLHSSRITLQNKLLIPMKEKFSDGIIFFKTKEESKSYTS